MAKKVTADELSKQIKVLQNQLFNAKAHFEIYMGVGKAWGKHILEIQDSPIFWQFTMKAHIDSAFLYLCRAYDTDDRAIHLSGFLDAVANNPGLFCEAVFRERYKNRAGVDGLAQWPRTLNLKRLSENRNFCNPKNPLIKKLLRWRNNVVAHRNYEEAMGVAEPLHKRHPLPFGDMETLIDKGLSILNEYSSLLDATEYSNQFLSHQRADYLYIFNSLRFARIGREWNRRRIRKNLHRKLREGK